MLRFALSAILSLVFSLAAQAQSARGQRTQFEPPDLPPEFIAGLKNKKYVCELINDGQLGVKVMSCPPETLGAVNKCGVDTGAGVAKCLNVDSFEEASKGEYCTMTVTCENAEKPELIPLLKQVGCKMSKYNGCPTAQDCFEANILKEYFIAPFDPLDQPEPPRDQPKTQRGVR